MSLRALLLRLRGICDPDEEFDLRSFEYQNYLIDRDYKPTFVKRQFCDVKNISGHEDRQFKPKVISSKFNLITVYNAVILKTLAGMKIDSLSQK